MGAGSSSADLSLLSVFDSIGDFASLGLPPHFGPAVLEAFRRHGGGVDCEASLTALCAPLRVPEELRPRLFRALDRDASGGLSFKEFSLGLVEFCSLDARTLPQFAWQLFKEQDAPGTGTRGMALGGLHAMCRVAYGARYTQNGATAAMLARAEALLPSAAAPAALTGRGELTLPQWLELVRDQPSLLQPVFSVQVQLRCAVLGEAAWRRVAAARGVGAEGGGGFTWPALELIRARLEGRAEEGEAAAAAEAVVAAASAAVQGGEALPARVRGGGAPGARGVTAAAAAAVAAAAALRIGLTAVEAGFIEATRGEAAALARTAVELADIRGRERAGRGGAPERRALQAARKEAAENVVRARALLGRVESRGREGSEGGGVSARNK